MKAFVSSCVGSVLFLATAAGTARAQQEPPRFRSSVDVTSIDVTVVDGRGRPILDLKPEEFTVRIDNAQRRVVSAEWTPLMTETGPPPPPPPEGYSTNEAMSGGRLILFVIDQPNIRFGATLSIQRTVSQFIDRLQPSDRIAAVGLGPGNASTPFTADRERVKRAISRMTGTNQQFGLYDHDVAQTEALDIRRGDQAALGRVLTRECAGMSTEEFMVCQSQVLMQATDMAADAQMNGELTVSSMRGLLRGLAAIDAPKTLIFVSEGFPADEQRAALHLRAAPRQPALRHHRVEAAGCADIRSSSAHRRIGHADRRGAWGDVRGDGRRTGRLRSDRIGAVRVLPARRRVGPG
jgi:VWFA-related protein